MKNNNVYIFNIPFLNTSKEELLKLITNRVSREEKTYIVTANAEIAIYAKQNNSYLDIINKATYIIPDGIGIVKGAKILNQNVKERIPGVELMVDLLNIANKNKSTVYFYGAKQEVIEKMVDKIKKQYPNIVVCGYKDGYQSDDNDVITNEIINLRPDYVFVAKGCPLQDEWISKVLSKVEKGVFMGVGGSFDVISGQVERAPEIWRKMNLEWLYRIGSDPKRWKRSLALPKFMVEVFKEKISN